MTDDLKQTFERLVADPPPPSAVPSEAVFARVRTARRRRTAGVATLSAAVVAAVAIAATSLTDINSSPPVTNTPSAPTTIVTGTPTGTPGTPSTALTSTPATNPSHTTVSTTGTAGHTEPATSGTPKGPTQGATNGPVIPPVGVHVSLKPVVQGLTVTMKVTLSGTALVPTAAGGQPLSTSSTDFLDLLGGTQYFFGDGAQSGSDAGAVNCVAGAKRTTGHQTYTLMNDSGVPNSGTHAYAKAGTYTFKYTVKYCGNSGWVPVTKTTKVTVK
jgi:hypothetical protein